MGNTFGRMFKVTTWGESHGDAVGVTIDGCPPLVEIDLADIQYDLCLLYTSPSPRDRTRSRMPSSA